MVIGMMMPVQGFDNNSLLSVTFCYSLAARSSQASETIKRLELEASQGRSKCLHLEGAIRVKEREVS